MRLTACLLLALLVSSAFFGICNGASWFEGIDPQEPQKIRLNMEHKIPVVSPCTAKPVCNLILNETESHSVNLTISVSTWAMGYQTGTFETWLSIDSQEPEKLFGILDAGGSAAGALYNRKYNVTLSGLGDGAHFMKIRVAGDYYGPGGSGYDCEGNVSVIIDTGPPKVSIRSLENKTCCTPTIPLNFITNEPISQSAYSLDGQENVTIAGNTTLTGLSNGAHNVTVYAWDTTGNIGASETIYFTVTEPFPIVPILAASGALIAIIGIGLLVYFKKRKH
jgi:hypothetical protein